MVKVGAVRQGQEAEGRGMYMGGSREPPMEGSREAGRGRSSH